MARRPFLARLLLVILTAVAVPALVLPALADEGMWTYGNFPSATVKRRYGVDITPAWLEHARLSTVRLSNCTASFVSPEGLILTNHHCAAQCLAEISSPQHDRLSDGYLARERSEEVRCPTQYADVLMAIEDITAKVAAATRGMDAKAAGGARKKALTQLEQACELASGKSDPRRCESVKLYEGGQYFLYKYKRYSDVRLVFAPEDAIAAFGGDPDNFQFPRWCLDMSVLRAYEDGKPARTPQYLPVNWNGPVENEPVFVSGHPGSTDRLLTVAQLDGLRQRLPFWLLRSSELRGRYIQFAQGGAEAARIVADPLTSLENSIKVRRKELDALLDGTLVAKKAGEEAQLRARAGFKSPDDPWRQIATAQSRARELETTYTFLEGGAGFNSALFRYARTLVRGAAERAKPNPERLREYTDSALPQVEQRLFAQIPVYPEREKLTLSFGLMRMREFLGPDFPLVANLLREISPEQLAAELVAGTQLADPAVRKQLWEGGAAAIAASKDPMIRIALLVDPDARAVRKQKEDEVDAPTDAAAERIAAARFKVLGTSVYPDATFTLRLSFGTVRGWSENGEAIVPYTRLARLYERSTGADPFRVPDSWLKARAKLDPQTPFNLTTTNDIVGGNSGSPLINAKGEIVGLIFDGNIHSISGSYWFDTARNRAVAVHPAIIRAALTQVYDATALAAELGLKP
jgi:Peptidase S46